MCSKGEYGATAAPVNKELQERVLDGAEPVTCRPADNLAPELEALSKELDELAEKKQLSLSDDKIDDVLTYALFPQIGLKFIENRGNPDAFEAVPGARESQGTNASKPAEAKSNSQGATASETYDVNVDGKVYRVEVAPSGTLTSVTPADTSQSQPQTASTAPAAAASSQSIDAPLAGKRV